MALDVSKGSDFYLSQIDNNIDEKISSLIDLIIKEKLPVNKNKKIKIIEFGIGGGGQFDIISKYAPCNSILIGADILMDTIKRVNIEGVILKQMDISNIQEEKESVSVINASAIFHEVSSYGDYLRNFGLNALKTTFKSVEKSLVPGGFLIYRDLLYPLNNTTGYKKVYYKSKAWKYFYTFFLDDFLRNNVIDFYNKEKVVYREDGDQFFIETSPAIHREFQRHYLTFRDFCRKRLTQATGVSIVDHFWKDKNLGEKIFLIKIKENRELVKKYNLKKFIKFCCNDDNVYRIDSDTFDLFFDDLLFNLFQKNEAFLEEIKEWKEREGSEFYLYADFIDLLNISLDSVSDEYILFPEKAEDMSIIERKYYNRYLEKNISEPETDGKQIILFKKIKLEEALIIATKLKDNQISFDNDKLSKLIKNIKIKIENYKHLG